MADVKHLTRSKPTDCVVDLGDGDTVTLSFDRNKITPAWMKEAEARDEERDVFSLPKMLADVVLSWDVTNEGAAFPPTAENIAAFSYPAQQGLLQRMLEAAIPQSAEGNASRNTLSTPSADSSTAQANPQNGPQPSASVPPSESLSPT